jgi:hypothetical protein
MATVRKAVHDSKSQPLIAVMKVWLETQLTYIPPRSGLANAMRYARNELDTYTVGSGPSRWAARTTSSQESGGGPLGDGLFPHHHGKAQ